jgi:hypothetical protein
MRYQLERHGVSYTDTHGKTVRVVPAMTQEWAAYQAWLAEGNTPHAPYITATLEQQREEMLARLRGKLHIAQRVDANALGYMWPMHEVDVVRYVLLHAARADRAKIPDKSGKAREVPLDHLEEIVSAAKRVHEAALAWYDRKHKEILDAEHPMAIDLEDHPK